MTFLLKNVNKLNFPIWPFKYNCAEKKSTIILTGKCMVFNRLDPGYFCICEGLHEENTFKSILCGCVEPNQKQDSPCIFQKVAFLFIIQFVE